MLPASVLLVLHDSLNTHADFWLSLFETRKPDTSLGSLRLGLILGLIVECQAFELSRLATTYNIVVFRP